jgi:hypothetical protein
MAALLRALESMSCSTSVAGGGLNFQLALRYHPIALDLMLARNVH